MYLPDLDRGRIDGDAVYSLHQIVRSAMCALASIFTGEKGQFATLIRK